MPMTETRLESFCMAINWLQIAGIMVRKACGRTIMRMVWLVFRPSAKTACRLTLAHRLDAATENLGHVRAIVKRKGEDCPKPLR